MITKKHPELVEGCFLFGASDRDPCLPAGRELVTLSVIF